jgi:hypothetical protein
MPPPPRHIFLVSRHADAADIIFAIVTPFSLPPPPCRHFGCR